MTPLILKVMTPLGPEGDDTTDTEGDDTTDTEGDDTTDTEGDDTTDTEGDDTTDTEGTPEEPTDVEMPMSQMFEITLTNLTEGVHGESGQTLSPIDFLQHTLLILNLP